MNSRLIRYLRVSCVVLSVFAVAGCVPLLVGAAAGAGGYAWYQGALVKEFNRPTIDVHAATIKGLKELGLPIIQDDHDRVSARMLSHLADGEDVHIDISARTEKTCRIKIRVGVFGNKLRSEMIYNAIQKNLL